MAKAGKIARGRLSHLGTPGQRIAVHVTPGAAFDAIEAEGDLLRIRTTAAPQDGKANAAVTRLLARALGVAPSRLLLVQGSTSREKLFRVG